MGPKGYQGPSGPAAYERLWAPEAPTGWAYWNEETIEDVADYDTFDGTCDDDMDAFIAVVGEADGRTGVAGEIRANVTAFVDTATALLDAHEEEMQGEIAALDAAVDAEFQHAYSSAWDKINRLRAEVDQILGSP